jgi:hypothetical protein
VVGDSPLQKSEPIDEIMFGKSGNNEGDLWGGEVNLLVGLPGDEAIDEKLSETGECLFRRELEGE